MRPSSSSSEIARASTSEDDRSLNFRVMADNQLALPSASERLSLKESPSLILAREANHVHAGPAQPERLDRRAPSPPQAAGGQCLHLEQQLPGDGGRRAQRPQRLS